MSATSSVYILYTGGTIGIFVLMIAIVDTAVLPCTGGYALGLTSAEGKTVQHFYILFLIGNTESCPQRLLQFHLDHTLAVTHLFT